MTWDDIKANWDQMTDTIKARWADLTDDDIARAGGDRDHLAGRIEERYGIHRDQAEDELDAFITENKAKF